LNIIKRDGRTAEFDKSKIVNAVLAAFKDVDGKIDSYAEEKAEHIGDYVEKVAKNKELTVNQIQDYVESGLCSTKRKDVAKAYILYRNKRDNIRGNTIDKDTLELLNGDSDYWNTENSNKNSLHVTTQRDYLAGIVSTDIAKRFLLSKEIVEAHDKGAIHVHDMDYLGQRALNNCGLIALNDMLQNGTVINGVMIEKPHRLLTASTIATQIILGVSSSQYGK
jgi:ribonucleoside-triphosphate reductase